MEILQNVQLFNYLYSMNNTDFQERIQSFFEIKIKQDNICKIFNEIRSKIQQIEEKILVLRKENRNEDGELLSNQGIKKLVTRQVINTVHPLSQKYDGIDQLLTNIKFNHEKLCSNMGGQFKTIEQRVYEFEKETRMYMTQQFMKMNEQIKRTKQKTDKTFTYLNNFVEQTRIKDYKNQHQLKSFQELLNINLKNSNNKPEISINVLPPFSVSVQNNSRKEIDQNGETNVSKKLKLKTKISGVKKYDKNGVQTFETQNSESPIQYASLLSRLQSIEKNFEEHCSIKAPDQVLLPSKQKLEEQNLNVNSIQRKQESGIIASRPQRSKWCSIVNKVYRNSTRADKNEGTNSSSYFKQQQQKTEVLEYKKVNESLQDLKYKYNSLQQSYETVLSKVVRLNTMQSAFQMKIEEVQKLKVDLSTINQINLRFRQIQGIYQQHQKKYLLIQAYNKDLKGINDSIKQIQLVNQRLAKKDEVKQAFVFVENKIKELAIILTDKFSSQKEGAINKVKQMHCLTCDKEFECLSVYKPSLSSAHGSRAIRKNESAKSSKYGRSKYQKIMTQQIQ